MRPWKVSLHNAPVIDNPLALKAHDWIFDGFFPRKIDRAPIYSAKRAAARKKKVQFTWASSRSRPGLVREGGVIVLSHPLCGASHSVQSRCSISFPYPMIPSHGPSSNRFKSAFAGKGARARARVVIPLRNDGSEVNFVFWRPPWKSTSEHDRADLLCHLVFEKDDTIPADPLEMCVLAIRLYFVHFSYISCLSVKILKWSWF